MKIKPKWLIAIISFLGLVFILLKETLKGGVNQEQIEDLKTGIKNEKVKNQDVIKKHKENIKLQNQIIAKKTKEVHDMTMNDQMKLAKRMGLTK